jgi:hypothetical protein
MDLVKGLSIMVGDHVEDTISLGFGWVSNVLQHGLHFFVTVCSMVCVSSSARLCGRWLLLACQSQEELLLVGGQGMGACPCSCGGARAAALPGGLHWEGG